MNKNFFTTIGASVTIFVALGLVLLAPIAVIFSWNILFGSLHTIPLGFDTYFAAATLMVAFGTAKIGVGGK